MATPSNRVEFSSFHRPGLSVGDYEISVKPSLSVKGSNKSTDLPTLLKQEFSIASERFVLNPADISTVFPPAGSVGDHSNVLPHLILKRSTLPWERKADPADPRDSSLPWLALLIFEDSPTEKPVTKLLTVAQLQTPNATAPTAANDPSQLQGTASFPKILASTSTAKEATGKLKLERGQKMDEVVTVIDVKMKVLAGLLPAREDLSLLAHVRQGIDDTANLIGEELAVIIGNRLPKQGVRSIVHLVSLENLYGTNGFYLSLNPNAPDTQLVRLVSLKAWSFSCLEAYKLSQGSLNLLEQQTAIPPTSISALGTIGEVTGKTNFINRVKGVLGAALTKKYQNNILNSAVHETFRGLLLHLNRKPATLQLPKPEKMAKEGGLYLSQGSTALAHFFRNGNHSASWYHGPFVPEITAVNLLGAPDISINELTNAQTLLKKLAKPGNDLLASYLQTQIATATLNEINRQSDSGPFTKSLIKAVIRDLNHLLKTAELYSPAHYKHTVPPAIKKILTTRPKGKTLFRLNRSLLEIAYPNLLVKSKFSLPILNADELLIYNPALGMFDVSYASAWELGRLLALKDKKFSLEFFNWKRHLSQSVKSAELALFNHLPYSDATDENGTDIPENIKSFFDRLSAFELIPFHYLVPEEAMLPVESIRFFKVDPFWLECLLDGAFSIGRCSSEECERDGTLTNNLRQSTPNTTGFLLRSDLVPGWPDLIVDGYDQLVTHDNFVDPSVVKKLDIVRMERLSPNILLCLFKGELKTLDIHLKPEVLHFGFDPLDSGGYEKRMRTLEGGELVDSAGDAIALEIKNKTISGKKIAYWRDKNPRVLNTKILADQIEARLKSSNQSVTVFSAAEFTLQMIEGVELVRFRLDST